MAIRRKYVKKASTAIVAIQLDLDTAGSSYHKWGDIQTCKPGDWIVSNEGDVYTVDRDTFARTYQAESPGLFRKVAPVWAEVAQSGGSIQTKEGLTHYATGAYLVFNDPEGLDGYAVEAASFETMYEPAE